MLIEPLLYKCLCHLLGERTVPETLAPIRTCLTVWGVQPVHEGPGDGKWLHRRRSMNPQLQGGGGLTVITAVQHLGSTEKGVSNSDWRVWGRLHGEKPFELGLKERMVNHLK